MDNILAVFNFWEPNKTRAGHSHRLVVESIVEEDSYGPFVTFGKVFLARGERRRELRDVAYSLADELNARALVEAEKHAVR